MTIPSSARVFLQCTSNSCNVLWSQCKLCGERAWRWDNKFIWDESDLSWYKYTFSSLELDILRLDTELDDSKTLTNGDSLRIWPNICRCPIAQSLNMKRLSIWRIFLSYRNTVQPNSDVFRKIYTNTGTSWWRRSKETSVNGIGTPKKIHWSNEQVNINTAGQIQIILI